MSSVNAVGESWVTKIIVDWQGEGSSGSVYGYLSFRIRHPCLVNVAQITFKSTLVDYDICQNKTTTGAFFSYTDSISLLTQTNNFCGNPVVQAVSIDSFPTAL